MKNWSLFAVISAEVSSDSRSYYRDTSELVGIVSLWPRENLLIFENQIVRIQSDAISSIEKWSKTSVVVKDVFGQVSTIDVRKIARAPRKSWNDNTAQTVPRTAVISGDRLEGPSYCGSSIDTTSAVDWGIGRLKLVERFYRVVWSEHEGVTQVAKRSGSKGASPAVLKIRGEICPIYIWDRDRYLYIGETNSRFGPLVASKNGREKVLYENAAWFLPLRTREKPQVARGTANVSGHPSPVNRP